MVHKVDKYVIVRPTGQDLAIASGDSGLVASENSEEVVGIDGGTGVVLDTARVVFFGVSAWSVVESAWEGVQRGSRHVIVGKDDDVIRVEAVVDEDMIGMADICLVPVIPVAIGPCDQDRVLCRKHRPCHQQAET